MMSAQPDMAGQSSDFLSSSNVLVITLAVIVVTFLYTIFRNSDPWAKYGVRYVNTGRILEFPRMAQYALQYGETVGVVREQLFLMTRDLDLLKKILVKDFNNFVNRQEAMISRSPIRRGVFFLRDAEWKKTRQMMSPTFSTGKLKRVSVHIHESAQKMAKSTEETARSGKLLKVRHLVGQYTTSIIARTAFGLRTDCIGEENDDQFTFCAKNIFMKNNMIQRYVFLVCLKFRWLYHFLFSLRSSVVEPCNMDSAHYFTDTLSQTLSIREEAERSGKGHVYNDFLQSLTSLKMSSEEGELSPSSPDSDKPAELISNIPSNGKVFTKLDLIGQCIFIILAGFDTTASTIHFCLLLLAENPEIQDTLFSEIQAVVESDSPTHEELSKLQYTEQVINEALRLYPPVNFITREAREDQTYGSMTIPAGAAVMIPIREIHRDPKNFPDPEKFDPERFSPENKAKRHPLAFMPFGSGPRLCIGQRLAYIEMKVALVQIIRKVKLALNDKTVPRKGEQFTVILKTLLQPVKPMELSVTLRE